MFIERKRSMSINSVRRSGTQTGPLLLKLIPLLRTELK